MTKKIVAQGKDATAIATSKAVPKKTATKVRPKQASAKNTAAKRRTRALSSPLLTKEASAPLYGGLDPNIRLKIEELRKTRPSRVADFIEVARKSERLTQDDLQIRVNTGSDL